MAKDKDNSIDTKEVPGIAIPNKNKVEWLVEMAQEHDEKIRELQVIHERELEAHRNPPGANRKRWLLWAAIVSVLLYGLWYAMAMGEGTAMKWFWQ